MNPVRRLSCVLPEASRADVIDVKEGLGGTGLRETLAALFSYSPAWIRLLFRVRDIAVRPFGLRRLGFQNTPMRPEEVPFTPGERVTGLFSVLAAEESGQEPYWISIARDKHLDVAIALLVSPRDNGLRLFSLCTVVWYKSCLGPVYYNVIRCFHHILAAAMLRQALRKQ